MASGRANPQLGKTAAILITGVIAGALLRYQESSNPGLGKADPTSQGLKGTSQAGISQNLSGPTKYKDRELPAGIITFSPPQWLDLIKDPKSFRITPSDCAPGPIAVLNDVPVVGRLFQSGERGPSLERHAKLFGWDKAREKEVREMFFQFGGQVERLRSEVSRVSYPGAGKVLIDYSDGDERLRDLTEELGRSLGNLMGERDSERLMLLTSIPSWEGQSRELSVSPAPDGKSLLVRGLDGGAEIQIEAGNDAAGRISTFLILENGQAPEGIDWQALVQEANLGRSTSR